MGFAIAGVPCFTDTFVKGGSSVRITINFKKITSGLFYYTTKDNKNHSCSARAEKLLHQQGLFKAHRKNKAKREYNLKRHKIIRSHPERKFGMTPDYLNGVSKILLMASPP